MSFPTYEARLVSIGCDNVRFLNRASFRHIAECDIDSVFCGARNDAVVGPRQRSKPKAVGDNIAEKGLRCRHRKHIHDQDEIFRAFGARKRVEVGDVHRRIADHCRSTEMV